MKNDDIKNILIVDDQPDNLQAIADIFERENFPCQVIKAPGGEVALRIIERQIPDLVITDWEMPGMDGIELIEKLKQNSGTVDIPVIMCTGVMTSSENLETALQAGAVDYIRKPVDPVELIARTKANLHLADKYKEIQELNRIKDNFLSIVSHDLRSPLGNIISFTDMILEEADMFVNKEIIDFISSINKQSDSIFEMLENLLSWVNDQRENLVFDLKTRFLSLAVISNIELLYNAAKAKNITIVNNVNESIKAKFDLILISAVVRNLISNAIKFTPENGTITIDAELKGEFVEVSVRDTGIGIEEARLEKIFDKSSRQTTLGTNKERGSGLGLKISADFVEKHNGRIWVESEKDKGSKFIFTLPVG